MKEFDFYPLKDTPYYDPDKKWVSPMNFLPETIAGFPEKVTIYDVTLRDGEQQAGVTFRADERLRIAQALDEMGVERIEACMPVVSKEAAGALKMVVNANLNAKVFAFVRTHPDDIKIALDCGAQYVTMEHSVNPYTCKYAYNLDRSALIDRVAGSIAAGKEAGQHVSFMGWDFSRTPIDYSLELYKDIFSQAKPEGLVLVDTYACATPYAIEFVTRKMHEAFPDIRLEFHCHNDFGLGVANCLAAVKGGAEVLHCAMNAIGERTGNVSTEELACALELLLNVDTGMDLTQLTSVSQLVSAISKSPVLPGKAIVGSNIFGLETGVGTHVETKLSSQGIKLATSSISNKAVGGPDFFFMLGKNSGRIAIEYFLEKNGLQATENQIKEINERVKSEAHMIKDLISEQQFLTIAHKVLG